MYNFKHIINIFICLVFISISAMLLPAYAADSAITVRNVGYNFDIDIINPINGSSLIVATYSQTKQLLEVKLTTLTAISTNVKVAMIDNPNVTNAKVMLFGDMDDITPVCAAIPVTIGPFAPNEVYDINKLQAAINAAAPGSTITIISGIHTLNKDTTILLNKAITIKGQADTIINVSGVQPSFRTTAENVVIDNIDFTKTDTSTSSYRFIRIDANKATVKSCEFTGLYTGSGTDSSVAILVTEDKTDVDINYNVFRNVRTGVENRGANTKINYNEFYGTVGIRQWVNYPATIMGNLFTDTAGSYDIIISRLDDTLPALDIPVHLDRYNSTFMNNIKISNPPKCDIYNQYIVDTQLSKLEIWKLKTAIEATPTGGTYTLEAKTYFLDATNIGDLVINLRGITVKGVPGTILKLTGEEYLFQMYDDSVLDGVKIEKTDELSQSIIRVRGRNVIIRNCDISEVSLNPRTSSAIYTGTSAVIENLSIEENTFTNLNYPIQLRGTGSIAGNKIYNSGAMRITGRYLVSILANTFYGNTSLKADIDLRTDGEVTPDIVEYNLNYDNAKTNLIATNNRNNENGSNSYNAIITRAWSTVPYNGTCNITNLQATINAAPPGDTITLLTGSQTLTADTTININKSVTIRGQSGAIVNVSGTQPSFKITADDVIFDNIDIIKTDTQPSSHRMIRVEADNIVITNCEFKGQYSGSGDSSVAILVTEDRTGVDINNNVFRMLRTGIENRGDNTEIASNEFYGTVAIRQWVNYPATITGNLFSATSGLYDIIISRVDDLLPALDIPEHYNRYSSAVMDSIKTANPPSCEINNQYVSDTDISNMEITKLKNAIEAIPSGGTYTLEAKTYVLDAISAESTINVENITVKGVSGTTIRLTGEEYLFELGDNAILDGVKIEKTDALSQTFIRVNGENVKIQNCNISETSGTPRTSNAISTGTTNVTDNLVIYNNLFTSLNYPIQLKGTGSITANRIYDSGAIRITGKYLVTISNNKFYGNTELKADIELRTDGETTPNIAEYNLNYDNAKTSLIEANNQNDDNSSNSYRAIVSRAWIVTP